MEINNNFYRNNKSKNIIYLYSKIPKLFVSVLFIIENV